LVISISINKRMLVMFEVLTRALLNMLVFWDAALCLWASSYLHIKGSRCVHLQDETILDLEDEDTSPSKHQELLTL
jgi:hypothetical protein